ncbi:MAG: DEAD/DEAH box helicase family protein [Rhodobacteraceae bacterium]|nr:DEAD/DEAH box helicase family protein [Paracoccaceae bacterium]
MATQTFQPGQRVTHADFGEGVVITPAVDGYVRVFFPSGERQVYQETLRVMLSRVERILTNVQGSSERLTQAWLQYEAHALPLMENAAALTAARIDLLPHQVVLTHRIATASPRRFLVADEVGLGKTIEIALVLRELASRGELNRALMVVPAGLVNNWHHELNDVFNLNFEVFGSEGDVTDRKSNAFAKHDRLIASVDTLKRRARIRRLQNAPPWDLIVFDEAHHLSAYRSGKKVRKTENYKLAEALRDHSRDLILLSATPHQGDHFRFWMLLQLLNPTLFAGPDEMLAERHRLNVVVFRRTKADACTPDGSSLFAKRGVHTESFTMSEEENAFYAKLRDYLRDGFALAQNQGTQGRALGFVMTIFQKIAASSFAAVRNTLRRRLLMLTIHEAILRDQALDIDGHAALLEEARRLIHDILGIEQNAIGKMEVERLLADYKLRLMKKLDEDSLALAASADTSEMFGAQGADMASMAVNMALPEERLRIVELLAVFPQSRETKVEKLLRGLGALWKQNPDEKIVLFATYLATVDLLETEINRAYPGQGVVVLRGGDHGAKLAAEKRFRRAEGPKVLICTAAGREGINLQFARILFNFDLPWNPMDVEQRIGRIHRYGQRDTSQVYNLVLSDTIEGKIFLLLDEKLTEIALALGKVDEQGTVTEDLRAQILGQLSERLSYDQLYRDALSDPELKRTQEELEAAMANASEARKVVFELFQDLDRFSLDDYQPFANIEKGQARIFAFLKTALEQQGGSIRAIDDERFAIHTGDGAPVMVGTLNRDIARADDTLELIGIDHPLLSRLLENFRNLPPEQIGAAVSDAAVKPCALSLWLVRAHTKEAESVTHVIPLAVDRDGQRIPSLEKRRAELLHRPAGKPVFSVEERGHILSDVLESMLQRELQHRGIVSQTGGYSADLIGWVEVS